MEPNGFVQLSGWEQFILFLFLSGILLLIIAPYIFAAFRYAQLTVQQFHIIEQERIRKDKEYEKKRNLMLFVAKQRIDIIFTQIKRYLLILNTLEQVFQKNLEY